MTFVDFVQFKKLLQLFLFFQVDFWFQIDVLIDTQVFVVAFVVERNILHINFEVLSPSLSLLHISGGAKSKLTFSVVSQEVLLLSSK